jgi:cobalt-zinc-cadmium efflux system protein
MGHQHNQLHHEHNHEAGKTIGIAFILNLTFTVIEFVGGFITNSVAIMSDAVHDLGDTFSLGLAWLFQSISAGGRSPAFSFGMKRFSLLAALVNALILVGGSAFVLSRAIPRLFAPESPDARGMFLFALAGMVFNGYAVLGTYRGKTMNEKVLTWHLLEDLLGWAAVLLTSIILIFTDWAFLDPLISILITLVILTGVIKNLRKTLFLFLQGVPDDFTLLGIEDTIKEIPGVGAVHDLHIWSLDGEHNVLTAHILLEEGFDLKESGGLKRKIKAGLRELGIGHITLELEVPGEECEDSCE